MPMLFRFRFRRSSSKFTIAVSAGIVIALLGPFMVRAMAILIQGPRWADWHFIWLYLLTSSVLTAAYFTSVAVWRFICHAHTAQQGARANATTCHDPCLRTARAK
jgi:hypothetical protein